MRKFGLAAFEDKRTRQAQFENVGDSLQTDEAERLRDQITSLQDLLRKYGRNHGKEISESPSLRQSFARLSARFGIDALSYSGAGMSSKKASKDYYHGLAVRIIDICRRTRQENGGIITIEQMVSLLADDQFPVHAAPADIATAVKSLAVFGPGFDIDVLPNGTSVIRSIPRELSSDNALVLMACDALGYVSLDILQANMGWSMSRSEYVIDKMVRSGLLWVDTQVNPTQYWSPSAIS